MKANAPEKIYINGFSAFATVPVKEGVEYIRTDAFIEKALKWISEIENGTTITNIDKFVEEFKEAIRL